MPQSRRDQHQGELQVGEGTDHNRVEREYSFDFASERDTVERAHLAAGKVTLSLSEAL